MTGSIDVSTVGNLHILTLSNPEALNALTPQMFEALHDALENAGRDRTCRAILITGAGEKAFCAGIDVKGVSARDAAAAEGETLDPMQDQFENLHYELGGIIRLIHRLQIPVIAAVNGHAIGAGFAIAAAADFRVASTNAKFADGFVKRGISGCEMGLSYFLPRLVGAATAFNWMMTGRRIDAEEALQTGLVGEVTDSGDLIAAARALGEQIAENAPMAVSMTKEVMWANLHAASLDQALALETRTQIMTRQSADAVEARASFLEKRTPVFGASDRPRPKV